MNVRGIVIGLLALLTCPISVGAQGFAGLGSTVDGFAMPDPHQMLSFPEDHGAHPDFRIEWWYLTANLRTADGGELGAQWTLFRSALLPGDRDGNAGGNGGTSARGWQSPQVWFAHAAVTTPDEHLFEERFARGGTGQVGAVTEPFQAWLDDWSMTATGDGIARLDLVAQGDGFSYDLQLTSGGPVVEHGRKGYSVKSSSGQASHYYSQPAYAVTGTVRIGADVSEVSGTAWLDREWSSQPLDANQEGWDWFALNLGSGDKVMLARVREHGTNAAGGTGQGFVFGTWIDPNGDAAPIPPDGVTLTPTVRATVRGRDIPTSWNIAIPGYALDLTVSALNPNAWMETLFPYWEGPVSVTGTHRGTGYLEMTGYR